MIILILALVSYVALVLDSGSGLWSLPVAALPQFIYLAAAVATMTCRSASAIVWAAGAGLLADVVQGAPLGLNLVLLANLSFASQLAGARGAHSSFVTGAAFVLLYATIAGFGTATIQNLLAAEPIPWSSHLLTAVSRGGGTAAVYLVIAGLGRLALRTVRWVVPRRLAAADRPTWAQ